MAGLMRALLGLLALFAAAPAHAEVVTFFTWVGGLVGASGASAAAVGAFVVTTAVSIVSSAYASSQAKKKARQEAQRKLAQDIANLQDRTITLLGSDSPHAVVYGSPAPFAGALVAMVTTGMGAEWTHLVIIFAAHECEAIDEIYIDDDAIAADENGYTTNENLTIVATGLDYSAGPAVHITKHLGAGEDVADPWLINACNTGGAPGMWTTAHKLTGYTYAVVSVNKVLDRFQSGPPNVKAKIRGKKVLDPRTGQTAYSRNVVLCLADFIRSAQGYGASADQLDINTWIAGANACDMQVYGIEADADPLNYGYSRSRYVVDGMFRTDQSRETTLQQLEEAMAGFTVESAGVWRFVPGAWTTPVMSLGDDDMVAPTAVEQTCFPGTARFNGARGTFIAANGNGVSQDFAPYSNPTFLAADGKEKLTDVALPWVGSQVRCHQIARIKVEKSRGGFTVRISPKMFAWGLQPGDRVLLSSAFFGFTNKSFIVTDWAYSRTKALSLLLEEDVPAYYDLADEQLLDAAPNTNLPNPFEAPAKPENLQAASGIDELARQGATLLARARISWNRSTTAAVLLGGRVRIDHRQEALVLGEGGVPEAGTLPWISTLMAGDAREVYLLGLDVGQAFSARVRFETAFASSDWAYVGDVLQGTGAPSDVSNLTLQVTDDGILASWLAPTDLDLIEWDRTQVRRGPTWEEAEGDTHFDGHATSALLGFFPAGLQKAWAAHHSRNGFWSTPMSASLTVLAPLTPAVQDSTQGRSVALTWSDCRTTQPIREYQIAKGDTLGAAVEIGRTVARSLTRVEPEPGLHRYWIRAVDMGGNAGPWGTSEAMTLGDFDDVPNIAKYVERVDSRLQSFRDQAAAADLNGILRAEVSVSEMGKSLRRLTTILEAKVDHNYAIYAEQIEVLVAADEAMASRITLLSAGLEQAQADILEEQLVRATADDALASDILTMRARVDDIEATYVSHVELTATLGSAIAENNEYLVSAIGPVGELSATVSNQSMTLASLDGNVAAQMMLKTEISAGGKRVIAGIKSSVSSMNGGTDVQSEVAVLASVFRVMNDLGSAMDAPFKVQDGRTYIDMAMIRNAEIDTLKVAGGAIVAPAFASGAGSASISFTVPAGQVWEAFAVAEFGQQSTWGPASSTTETRSLTGAGSTVIHPDAQWQDMGEGGGNIYRFPASMMTGIATFGAGFQTITAVGGETTRLAVFIGKRGA
ncbi:protein of unknown function [Pseudacidovorax sp. RU35E]|nr:protein of unknown function [Pseudacidovorax sp. RU35E]